jgi:hypothetical protein
MNTQTCVCWCAIVSLLTALVVFAWTVTFVSAHEGPFTRAGRWLDEHTSAVTQPRTVYRLSPTQAAIGTMLRSAGWPLSAQGEAELREADGR